MIGDGLNLWTLEEERYEFSDQVEEVIFDTAYIKARIYQGN